MPSSLPSWLCLIAACALSLSAGQQHQPPQRPQTPAEDPAAVLKGKALFQSSCGFCHGNDAAGSRAPDLLRSVTLNHDEAGSLLGPVIRNGRPDKGMPSFATLKDDQISAIVAFLHSRAAEALHSGHVASDYPAAKLLTGNKQAGQEFFNGAGQCTHCHSVAGDLAGIASKESPINLQQSLVYPQTKKSKITATVITSNGQSFAGVLMHDDEFNIAIQAQDGWYRSWPRDQVKVEIHDPMAAHRELTRKFTDADMHNLFAYLETLK